MGNQLGNLRVFRPLPQLLGSRYIWLNPLIKEQFMFRPLPQPLCIRYNPCKMCPLKKLSVLPEVFHQATFYFAKFSAWPSFIWLNCSAKLRFIWRNCLVKYLGLKCKQGLTQSHACANILCIQQRLSLLGDFILGIMSYGDVVQSDIVH